MQHKVRTVKVSSPRTGDDREVVVEEGWGRNT